MIYCIDPNSDEPILLINKHIGYDEEDGQGIDGAIFQQELLQLDSMNKKRIQVWINSVGGGVMDGYDIYTGILKSKTPVDTYAVGGVASIAAVIFQAGRKRIMTDYSWLMYHNPFGSDNKNLIETMRKSIVTMIEQRCGMNEAKVTEMLNRTSYIPAAEALTLKLCDTIDESKFENAKYLRKITDTANFHKECNKVLNSILNNNQTKKNMDNMKLVTNRLKLNDAATEENVVKAIDAIENSGKVREQELLDELAKVQDKAKADESELDKLKAKFTKLEADKKAKDAEYDECKSMLDAMETDKKTAEENAKTEKCKNMIEGFAKIGRIKNEAAVILKWENTAKSLGFDEVKAMIEDLPLNKKAEDIKDVINKVDVPTTAVGLAAKLRAERNNK